MTHPNGHRLPIPVRDWGNAVVVFLVALTTRIPFRSHFAYHWDSAQFALAIGEYNIRISQPHVPGFFLYVVLGRLVNLLVGEPHAALVWLSVIAGAALAAMGYLLAATMFGSKYGLATGLILLTSPLCWFHSEIALTTIVDSALVVSFVFVCWRAIQLGVTWTQTILLAVLLAAVAGVRQQSAPVLIPLWLYVFGGFARPRGWKLACATALAAGLSLLWLVPTVRSAGGLVSYIHLLRLKEQIDARMTVWGGRGMDALLINAISIGRVCWAGLLGAGIIALMEFVHWAVFERLFSKETARRDCFCRANKTQLCVLALWAVPMILFWMFMYVTMPGYMLNFFPATAILVSFGLVRFSERVVTPVPHDTPWFLYGILAVMVMTNVVVFVLSPRGTKSLLTGLPLTVAEIREHDTGLAACFRTIRQNWPSQNIIVCHRYEDFYWGFRQFQYHLPEYRNVLLQRDPSLPGESAGKLWLGYKRRTEFVEGLDTSGRTTLLLVVPPGSEPDIFGGYFDLSGVRPVEGAYGRLYSLPAQALRRPPR